jgi:serine/threonine-protein kinase RsbT
MSTVAWRCSIVALGLRKTKTVTERLEIRTAEDVVRVRQRVRAVAVEAGMSLVDQTKIVTAASELARNTLDYGGGGTVDIAAVNAAKRGVHLVFEDCGPGIKDIDLALRDGYTTGNGLGLGLGGAKRLCSEFTIASVVGQGTRISCARWK